MYIYILYIYIPHPWYKKHHVLNLWEEPMLVPKRVYKV